MVLVALKNCTIDNISGKSKIILNKKHDDNAGFYKEFCVKKGMSYNIIVKGSIGKMKGRLRLHVENDQPSGLYYAEYFNFVKGGIQRLYQHTGKDETVRIGFRFVGCMKGDHYFVTKLNIKHLAGVDLIGKLRNLVSKKPTLEWREDEEKGKPIEMTVALPAQKAEKIIWLALESLKNQTVGVGWELIIWDDWAHSLPVLRKFIGHMPMCQRVIYRALHPLKDGRTLGSLKGTFPLIDKWIGMAFESSDTSKIYVLQAADCYSPEKRLAIHYEHFKNESCYFSTQTKGLFYNLLTNQKMFYNAPPKVLKPCVTGSHLNMAMRTQDMRLTPPLDRNKSIDGHIRLTIKRLHNINKNSYILPFYSVDTNQWAHSIDTDGANRISLNRRKCYSKPVTYFQSYAVGKKKLGYKDLTSYIPKNVINFLVKYR